MDFYNSSVKMSLVVFIAQNLVDSKQNILFATWCTPGFYKYISWLLKLQTHA